MLCPLLQQQFKHSGPSRSSFDLSCIDELSKSETATVRNAVRRLISYIYIKLSNINQAKPNQTVPFTIPDLSKPFIHYLRDIHIHVTTPLSINVNLHFLQDLYDKCIILFCFLFLLLLFLFSIAQIECQQIYDSFYCQCYTYSK